jgi:hypothetical protein
MTTAQYPGCIQELYQSEVTGEAGFLALVALSRNEFDKYHLATVLQLETETKARLRPLMLKYGLPLEEQADPAQTAGFVAAYQENSWHEFLASLRPLVDSVVARFEEIAEAGSPEDQDVLQSMVTHEQSFVIWIERELAGQSDSLGAVIEQLQFPLPVPEAP